MMNIEITRGGGEYFDRLRKRMDKAGITQTELSVQSGIDDTQLSRWFNKRVKNPRLESVLALERAMEALTKRKRRK
jgi:transcriptional regulator with XRE-family HTH domain